MNRREFLQALGIAAGASVLPVKATAVVGDPVALDIPDVADTGIVSVSEPDGIGIQIDEKFYTLNEGKLELSLPPAPYAFDGWSYFDTRIQREWTFSGSTFDVFENHFDLSPVPVLFHVGKEKFTGQAAITEIGTLDSAWGDAVTHFTLRGVGPISVG